ncbi:MAG: CSLREA domain-containing protein [Caldilineaceae bacterium]|nr:CSLREA domain-containing protein [Caldilineaceae bacterium]
MGSTFLRRTATSWLMAAAGLVALLALTQLPAWASAANPGYGAPPTTSAATATITVTTFADELTTNGNCSLREAIQSANTGSSVDGCAAPGTANTIIRLGAGVYALAIAGANEDANQSGDLDLLAAMEVDGRGPLSTTIDGAAIDRILHIHSGAVVVVRGVTLQNGRAPDGMIISPTVEAGQPGGAIFNSGQLTLIESVVTASHAGSGASSLSDYFSSDRGGAGGNGGGIYSDGALQVQRSTILSNSTGSGGDGPCGGGGDGGEGGGIFNSGVLSLTESTVQGNLTGSSGHGTCPPGIIGGTGGAGGAIANYGSAVVEFSSILANSTAAGVDVGGTHAQGGHGGPGGGIANAGSLHIDNSTISGNAAGNGGSGGVAGGGDGGDGGGVYNVVSGTLAIDAATITRNSAGVAGSGMSGTGGGADGQGGGVANTGSMQARNTAIAENVARRAPDCAGTLDSYDYNLVESIDGCTLAGTITHVLTGTAPLLGALADNGGPTLTHDPLLASPLRDGGACTTILGAPMDRDQRGWPRPMDATCDMGAVEWGFADWQWLPAIKLAD